MKNSILMILPAGAVDRRDQSYELRTPLAGASTFWGIRRPGKLIKMVDHAPGMAGPRNAQPGPDALAALERGAEARAGGAARLALARRRAIGAMVAPRLPPALGRLRLRLDDDVPLNDGFEWGVFLVGNARDKRPSRKEVRKGTGPFPEVHGFHDEVWERTQRAASLFDDDPNAGKWLRQQAHYFHRAHVTLRRATHRVAHDRVARGRPGA